MSRVEDAMNRQLNNPDLYWESEFRLSDDVTISVDVNTLVLFSKASNISTVISQSETTFQVYVNSTTLYDAVVADGYAGSLDDMLFHLELYRFQGAPSTTRYSKWDEQTFATKTVVQVTQTGEIVRIDGVITL